MDKIKIDKPIIVEGKYDKIKLMSLLEAQIIQTDGFGLFKNKEKERLIRRIAEKNGVIVLTDSDGAGLVIRGHINSILPKDKVTHLFTPQIKGKEKRKSSPSKSGFLGVEGIEADALRKLFAPFETKNSDIQKRLITKTDLYNDGLSGSNNSAEKRIKLQKLLELPKEISSNMLLDLLNVFCTYDEYKAYVKQTETETDEG